MKLIMIMLIALCILPIVFAQSEPTQQFNKIFLNPFYRASMTNNVNNSYSLTINPPDKVSSVQSAIISFDIYLTPTVTFSLWVNNISCNNPTYAVSTTFAGAGQSRVTFDCTNIITKAGTYNIILKPVGANTGAVNGWIDLTYTNNPFGKLELSGTEYSPNDPATFFVQLKDSYGNPILNGSCYMDVWYPLNSTGLHPYTIQDAPMIKALGDDGIYYYDMTAPSILGVYMLSARCSYSFNYIEYYPETENIYYPIRQINTGTFQGDSSVLNSKQDNLYERCDGTLGNPCSSNYTFNISVYGAVANISNINIYYSGQDDTNGKTLTMAYWNGTGFTNLANVLTYSGTAGATPTSYDEYLTNSIPLNAIINNTIKVRLIATGSSRAFHNWLSLTLLSAEGTIQDVKGSSEMHITNLANATLTLTQNVTANINYTKIAETTWNYNGTVSPSLLSQISQSVWNFFNSTSNFITLITNSVWTRTDRNLTYYSPMNVTTQVINLTTQNVTVINQTVNVTTQIVNVVNQTVNVTTEIVNVTTQVINLTTQNITIINQTVNETAIAQAVWSWSGAIHNNILTNFASAVWNWASRYVHGINI